MVLCLVGIFFFFFFAVPRVWLMALAYQRCSFVVGSVRVMSPLDQSRITAQGRCNVGGFQLLRGLAIHLFDLSTIFHEFCLIAISAGS